MDPSCYHGYQHLYFLNKFSSNFLLNLSNKFETPCFQASLSFHLNPDLVYLPLHSSRLQFPIIQSSLPIEYSPQANVPHLPVIHDEWLKKEENSPHSSSNFQTSSEACLRIQIQTILTLFIEESGKDYSNQIEKQRFRYLNSPELLTLFDFLKAKYISAQKSREEMIRLILRKALTYMKESIQKREHISARRANIELCKRYFPVKSQVIRRENKDEEYLLSLLLPYKKDSRYSTPTLEFINEIFSSSSLFYDDYQEYLKQLGGILEADNYKRIDKFVEFLVCCMKTKKLDKIKHYRLLPWGETWLNATKIIARELPNIVSFKGNFKKKEKKD